MKDINKTTRDNLDQNSPAPSIDLKAVYSIFIKAYFRHHPIEEQLEVEEERHHD